MSTLNSAYGKTLIVSKYDDNSKDYYLGLDYCSLSGNKNPAYKKIKYESSFTLCKYQSWFRFNQFIYAYRKSLKLRIVS